jgi:hypothetical protein
MKKRGQISIFILLGITIIIAFGLMIFLRNDTQGKTKPAEVEQKFESYYFFLDACLKDKAEASIPEMTLNGGYFQVPNPSVEIIFFSYPYYLFKDQDYFPTKERIENELADIFTELSKECYEDLTDVIEGKFKTNLGEVHSTSLITKNSVVLNIDYPIIIESERQRQLKSEYRFEIPAKLDSIYEALKEFQTLEKETPEGLCWTCISDIAEKHMLDIEMEVYNKTTVLFSFRQNATDYPITWIFANKY